MNIGAYVFIIFLFAFLGLLSLFIYYQIGDIDLEVGLFSIENIPIIILSLVLDSVLV